MSKTQKVERTTKIQSKPEAVYKALTTPSDIRYWYSGIAQLAVRPHGHFTIADSTGDVYESGEYLEVKPNELLHYRMEHHGFYRGSEVKVSLKPEDGGTIIDLSHFNLAQS